VPPRSELVDEPVREDLRAAASERHLRAANRDPHCFERVVLELGLKAIHLFLEVVDQPERSRVERALVVCERLDVPAHELAQDRLDRRPDATAHAWPEPKRAISRHRPQALGLGPSDAPVVLAADPGARIGSRSPHLFAERPEELLDVDGALRRNPCRIAIFGVVSGHRGILAGAQEGGMAWPDRPVG
jgi:hypothetical protein